MTITNKISYYLLWIVSIKPIDIWNTFWYTRNTYIVVYDMMILYYILALVRRCIASIEIGMDIVQFSSELQVCVTFLSFYFSNFFLFCFSVFGIFSFALCILYGFWFGFYFSVLFDLNTIENFIIFNNQYNLAMWQTKLNQINEKPNVRSSIWCYFSSF